MSDAGFPDAFFALTGHRPFGWQARLFERFAAGEVPDACDIPTGLGKTLVMAIWLAALDLSPGLASDRRLPRRLVYVVDRRAVVDQATAEAERFAERLGKGEGTDPAIAEVRARLGLADGESLSVSTLRGQFADNRRWLDDPSRPAIVVGTVDMIGSQLLFQGYNVSRGMRPVHAALLGSDSLIVLDEAHLVPPFQALVEQVRRLSDADRERAPAPALRLMTLSATGRGAAARVFTLEPEDESEDDVVRRLDAPKRLKVEPEVAGDKLAETLAERAWRRGEGGRRVVVYCNSRKVAQDVQKDLAGRLRAFLEERFGKAAPEVDTVLQMIVGARRVREREVLAESLAFRRFSPRTAADAAAGAEGLPAFLVATSAGEVGVDLDADHMVADLVSWERMVQRLGRVNRLGAFGEGSLVDIFPATTGKDKEAELAIEKEKLAVWRAPFDSELWPADGDDRRDASPGMLRRLRGLAEFAALAEQATSAAPLRPALTRAHVDAWSMTALDEHPGRTEVAPWIRGWVEEEPQTELVWRRFLPIRAGEDFGAARRPLALFFDAAPPHLSEILGTTSWDAARVLKDRAKAMAKASAAATDEAVPADGPGPRPSAIAAVILAPDRTVERLVRFADLADLDERQIAGRLVVIDARLGGLDGAGLLDAKSDEPPPTLDDPEAPAELAGEDETHRWSLKRLEEIRYRVRCVPHDEPRDRDCRVSYQRFLDTEAEETSETDSAAREWRVESWISNEQAQARQKQTVALHHADVERWARRIGWRLGLADADVELLVRVAAVHDLGKMRKNWQAYAGNFGYARGTKSAEPLAKFTTRSNPTLLKIGDLTYRHEFGSLRDVLDQGLFDDLDLERRDLALHLVAAHHGNARPVIAPADEKYPTSISAELAREAALRFARLQRRWGAWGLAWWEALFRTADIAASRALDELPAAAPAPSDPVPLSEDR